MNQNKPECECDKVAAQHAGYTQVGHRPDCPQSNTEDKYCGKHQKWNRKIDCENCRKTRVEEEKIEQMKANTEKLIFPISEDSWEKEFDRITLYEYEEKCPPFRAGVIKDFIRQTLVTEKDKTRNKAEEFFSSWIEIGAKERTGIWNSARQSLLVETIEALENICNNSKTERGLGRAIANYIGQLKSKE